MKIRLITFIALSIWLDINGQDLFDDGKYCSSFGIIERTCYTFKSDTFETNFACDLGCITVKGFYEIWHDSIYFYSFSPDDLYKTKVEKIKKPDKLGFSSVEYEFNLFKPNGAAMDSGYTVWFYNDSSVKSLLTIHSYGSQLGVYNNHLRIDKIRVSDNKFKYEPINIYVEPDFFGKYKFNITLNEGTKRYMKRDSYAYKLIRISDSGFVVEDKYGQTEFRKEEY